MVQRYDVYQKDDFFFRKFISLLCVYAHISVPRESQRKICGSWFSRSPKWVPLGNYDDDQQDISLDKGRYLPQKFEGLSSIP